MPKKPSKPKSDIPSQPNFEALETGLRESESQRKAVLSVVGNLLFNWGNNEGLFVIVLKLLLRTDMESAQIVFFTLNTTQTRLDLIRRLAIQHTEGKMREQLLRYLDHFKELSRTRNDIAHAMWDVSEEGYLTATYSIRFTAKFEQGKIGEHKPISQARINEIQNICQLLVKLNRSLWVFLPGLEAYMKRSPAKRREKPAQPRPSP